MKKSTPEKTTASPKHTGVKVAKFPKSLTSRQWGMLTALSVMIVIIYMKLFHADFINYDDDIYITQNPFLQDLSWENTRTLFTSFYLNQYAPVAMLIMAIQMKIFGMVALPFKIVSIAVHVVNVLLVFAIIRRLASQLEYAFITAALFAVHPLHVESVAWLSASMKIGIYSLFFLISILMYVRYVESKRVILYFASLVAFMLACLSKEQAIALAFTLPVIDYLKQRDLLSRSVILEKIPFVLGMILFGISTLTAVEDMQGNVPVFAYYSVLDRLVFASYALAAYVFKIILPVNLSALYTYPLKDAIPSWYYLTPIIAIGIFYALYRAWKKGKHIIVFAIMFFLVNISLTLLSQILSVRDAIMADRYMYLPSIGLFLIIAHFVISYNGRKGTGHEFVNGILLACVFILAASTYIRAGVWQNSYTVLTDVIEKESLGNNVYNPNLALAFTNRGVARRSSGDIGGALEDYNMAILSNPRFAKAYLNRGNVYFFSGRLQEAIADYNTALKYDKDESRAYSGRGAAYAQLGERQYALADLSRAIELDPVFADALQNRILLYYDLQKNEEALVDFDQYLRIKPLDADMINLYAIILARLNKMGEAESAFNRSISLMPEKGEFYRNRSFFMNDIGNRQAALADAEQAVRLGVSIDTTYMRSLR